MSQDNPTNAINRVTQPAVREANTDSARMAVAELQKTLSFLAMLENPAWMDRAGSGNAGSEGPAGSSLPVPSDELGASTPKSPAQKTDPAKSSAAQAASQPASDNTPLQPVESSDLEEMWLMDSHQLTQNDLKVLHQLVQGLPMSMQQMLGIMSPAMMEQFPQAHYKSLGVSKGLAEMLEQAYKSQRPLRVNLSDNTAVILRLGRNGRVSAEFMTSDQAAELLYRQHLQELKNRLESKQLPYGQLTVRHWKQQEESHKQQ